MPVGVVVEAEHNFWSGQIDITREEISEFMMDILDSKVNDLAIGFFKTIIHYLYYWFSTPYATLYDFKATMLADCDIETDDPQYANARIFRFQDGTPLYDFSNRFSITTNPAGEKHLSVARDYDRLFDRTRIHFFQDLHAPNRVFSRANGTHFLYTSSLEDRLERRFAIFEGRGGHSLDNEVWFINTASATRRIRNQQVALVDPPVEPEVRLAQAPQNPGPTAQPVAAAGKRDISECCKSLAPYGNHPETRLVDSPDNIAIFTTSKSFAEISYSHFSRGEQSGYLLYLPHLSSRRPVSVTGFTDADYYYGEMTIVGNGHLGLHADDPNRDIVLIEDHVDCGFRIRRPGRHDILITQGHYNLSAKLDRPKRPVLLKEIPDAVQNILESTPLLRNQDQRGMSLYRAASSQGLLIYYYGKREKIELYQKWHSLKAGPAQHDFHINLPGATLNGGKIEEDGKPISFAPRSSREVHTVLITDFVNPNAPEKTRFLLIEQGHAAREIQFNRVGTPVCNAPQLENSEGKAQQKAS